jgi:2,4-dienoyl-CoA reductase-like NADH-dependent reductase (Old Yellow Enzyme family)
MRIGHDRCIPGLKGLVQKIHDTSESKVIPQIIDFLKISVRDPQKYLSRLMPRYPAHPELLHYDEATLERLLTPREWQDYRMGYRQRVEDLSRDELTQLPGLFARAARRAREAGFDGVELHFAHAYTLASFLSRTNRRTDEYGGPALENRLRLPLEVIKAVRLEVGHDFTLGLRFLGSEDVEGGSELEDACAFAVAFAKAGVDFISVSRGGRFDDARQPRIGEAAYPYTGHSGLMCMPTHAYQEGYNLHLPAGIRAAVRAAGFETPVVGAGRLNTYAIAETALQTGALDLVGMARGLLADPDWPRKTRDGTGEIHYCKYNNICEALDRKHLPVRCQLWMKKPVGQLHAPEDW